MTNELTIAATAAGLLVALGSIAAALWWLLMPRLRSWLQAEIIDDLRATRRQVSENHHDNDSPTVLDRIDDVERTVHGAVEAVSDRLDAHELTSARAVAEGRQEAVAMWRAIAKIAEAKPPEE